MNCTAKQTRDALDDLCIAKANLERAITDAVSGLTSKFSADHGVAVRGVSIGFVDVRCLEDKWPATVPGMAEVDLGDLLQS